MRMTRQRKIILDELKKSKNHPSADQLWERVRKRLPRISLGTVYRNLEKLADEGMILRLELPNQPRRYDANTNDHYHIFCVECARTEDLAYHPSVDLTRIFSRKTGYKILGYKIHILGICPECQKKKIKKGGG